MGLWCILLGLYEFVVHIVGFIWVCGAYCWVYMGLWCILLGLYGFVVHIVGFITDTAVYDAVL